MNTTEEKYILLINRLKANQPILENPGRLTNDIMSSIKTTDRRSIGKIIVMARPWISIAAVFLIGLFIYQQSEAPEPLPSGELVFSEEKTLIKVCFDSLAFEANNKDRLLKTYLCYLQQEEFKKKNSELLMQKLLKF